MELFIVNEDLAVLEQALAAAQGDASLDLSIVCAWHLRQRDCQRALALALQAEDLLAKSGLTTQTRSCHLARLQLVRAEIKLLFGDGELAHEMAVAATAEFTHLQDALGTGDGHWLQASIYVDRGNSLQVAECLKQAAVAYQSAGDPLRRAATAARLLVNASFREPVATAAELQRQFPLKQKLAAAVLAWVSAARANVAGLTNDPGGSIKHDLVAYHSALDSGQVRQALVSVTNAAESFATLGDLDAALEWSEQALSLARKITWPASIGFCLMQLGDAMRLLGRHDESRHYLQEALVLMGAQAGSRNYELGLGNLGQLALDVGDYAAGLEWFTKLEVHGSTQIEPDLAIKAWRGQANALFRLGRVQEAQSKAEAALALARQQGNAEGQIQILRIFAQMHLEHNLDALNGVSASRMALHYLDQALSIAGSIGGYDVSPDLMEQVASAHAAAGDYDAAYKHMLAANAARNRTRHLEAQKRALALQVRQQVEQARADAEHHRKLASTLKDTAATLETLGTIGREITASLDAAAVFEALHRHVHQLLDATAFAIYLMEGDGSFLKMAFGIEAGAPLPLSRVPTDSATAVSARCARERKEVLVEVPPGKVTSSWIPGTLPTRSLLYAPLMVGERLLGVMTIQSPNAQVYGERERSIFHTLCAYGAIALDNASAYAAAAAAQQRADRANAELLQTQAQLVKDIAERERIDRELQALNNDLEVRIAVRTHEMRATLEMLAESQQKLQGIVDTALDAVVRVDASGTIVGWNLQAHLIFGWTPQQAIGRALHHTIIPKQHREAHLRGMARYILGGASTVIDRRIEITALHESGREFPIELAITRVSLIDPQKFEFCAFIRDITQRRQAEEEIRTSLERQRELNQLKSRFVSMASHEFRTPLATILSSTDLLAHYYARLPEHERTELFGAISLAVKRMTKMLEDILVIGKDEEDRIEFKPLPMALDAFCQSMVQEQLSELHGTGPLKHRLELSIQGDALHASFDEKLLRHIFGNLLSNAIKYSPNGGTVGFDVHAGEQVFTFQVRDQGIGIPETDLPQLFETFHRAANVGTIVGTGLGLAIVKRSVDLHGGSMEVRSALGQGTVFTVTLPRISA
ncbi:MAG: PAS domain S-box protein [Rhodoferax sp.]|nr:PAS domain S-box protein [Rhodoferax sp.]MCF8208679.1 PAS domain S-box protein [Rhodoferax sp.]